jgi:cytochrome c biogenesis protein CcmG/thiol:disulfide interchange protein DsbE
VRKLAYGLPLVLFLALAGYFALALTSGRDPETLPSAMLGKPAPDFDLAALGGGPPVAFATLKGQVVVVNFFASWCVPCRLEHPVLMELANHDRIAITGIAYKDAPAAAKKLLDDAGDPYATVGLDQSGRTGIDFGVYGVPETYVIDKAGRIQRRYVGPLTPDVVQGDLLPLLRRLGQS